VPCFTYNLINPVTQYQRRVDMQFDWGASQFLTWQIRLGAVGHAYQEIGCDSGSGDRVHRYRLIGGSNLESGSSALHPYRSLPVVATMLESGRPGGA
jgi:hypothetical protein